MDERLAVVDDSFNFKLFDSRSGCEPVTWTLKSPGPNSSFLLQVAIPITQNMAIRIRGIGARVRALPPGSRRALGRQRTVSTPAASASIASVRRAAPLTCSVGRHPLVDQFLAL